FSSRRRHTRFSRDWSSDVCSSDLAFNGVPGQRGDLLALICLLVGHLGGFGGADDVAGYLLAGSSHLVDGGGDRVGFRPLTLQLRSEERRVGKERSSRGPASLQ